MCSPVLPPVVEVELPPLESYLHGREVGTQDVCILSEAAIKQLRAWLHRIDMTVRYDKARANSPCDDDHKLGALLDYFLMPENTGVSLEDIIGRVVAENVDALEVCLVKGKKVLKEATKAQLKLLTRVAKQKMAQERSHSTEAAHQEATKVLCQVTEQLEWVRGTIAYHTAEIACIDTLLKDCESTEEESSSLEEGSPLRSGSRDSTAATQQSHDDEHDIEMKDVGDVPNPPQGMATQTDPSPEATEDDPESEKDVIVEDERIIIEGEALPPSHWQMIDSWIWMTKRIKPEPKPSPEWWLNCSLKWTWILPHPHLQWVISLVATRKLKRSPWLRVTSLTQFEFKFTESYKLSMEAGAPTSCQMIEEKKRSGTWPGYNDSLYRIIQEMILLIEFL